MPEREPRTMQAGRAGWRWAAAAGAAVVVGLLIGVPTALVPTQVFGRMTQAPWWSYPVWVAVSVLVGLAVVSGAAARPSGGRGGGLVAAGAMTVLAVGCPLCNKVVLAVLGTSGALTLWAPLQLALALAALAIAARACWSALDGGPTRQPRRDQDDLVGGGDESVGSGAIRATDKVSPAGRPRVAADR